MNEEPVAGKGPMSKSVAVIIAAFDARQTIARAVKSALAQPGISQVIVVDDASRDDTVNVAVGAAQGDARFTLLRQSANAGPAAARNLAIDYSTADWIAVLDADDVFLPGRIAAMDLSGDWDIVADNILFVGAQSLSDGEAGNWAALEHLDPQSGIISFAEFVSGNISSRKRVRGELGFLKPILRREFLIRHDLRYCENCRLGEDFLLITEALARGARFRIESQCGYAAMRRDNSLSSRHGVQDLEQLARGVRDLLSRVDLVPSNRRILREHLASVERKVAHRRVLETRRQQGMAAGLRLLASHPSVIVDLLQDRLHIGPRSFGDEGMLMDQAQFGRFAPGRSAA